MTMAASLPTMSMGALMHSNPCLCQRESCWCMLLHSLGWQYGAFVLNKVIAVQKIE